MTYSLDERATGNGIDGSNDVANKGEQKLRQPKVNQTALRAALATAQQEAAEAQRRLDELRGTLIDLRQERDAWRAQAQRLTEKLKGKRPAWWQWGTGG